MYNEWDYDEPESEAVSMPSGKQCLECGFCGGYHSEDCTQVTEKTAAGHDTLICTHVYWLYAGIQDSRVFENCQDCGQIRSYPQRKVEEDGS